MSINVAFESLRCFYLKINLITAGLAEMTEVPTSTSELWSVEFSVLTVMKVVTARAAGLKLLDQL